MEAEGIIPHQKILNPLVSKKALRLNVRNLADFYSSVRRQCKLFVDKMQRNFVFLKVVKGSQRISTNHRTGQPLLSYNPELENDPRFKACLNQARIFKFELDTLKTLLKQWRQRILQLIGVCDLGRTTTMTGIQARLDLQNMPKSHSTLAIKNKMQLLYTEETKMRNLEMACWCLM